MDAGEDPLGEIAAVLGIPLEELRFTQAGRLTLRLVPEYTVQVSLGLSGGKGGFGSLLRSMNPKKTLADNFESCRDLSGRRLRTVANEQRLEEWRRRQQEEEKFVAEENKEYEQQRRELHAAIRQNNFKVDDLYKAQVQSGAALIARSVQEAAAKAKPKKRKAEFNIEELIEEPPTAPLKRPKLEMIKAKKL